AGRDRRRIRTEVRMRRFLATNDSWVALVQRVALAAVMFPHGAQKLLGWFGGYGWDGTMKFFTEYQHVPAPVAALVILGEFFGSIGLVFGAFTRLAAAAVAPPMVGAIP